MIAVAPEEVPPDVPLGREQCATCEWWYEPEELVVYKGAKYCNFCARMKEADEIYERLSQTS